MNRNVERVRDALSELIKAALVSDDGRSLAYREAARGQLAALAAEPPDPASLRMEGAWTLAIQEAERPERAPEQGRVNLTLPRQPPFDLDALLAPGFDVDAAVEQIRRIASTG
ncbi:hypothetical protein [Methylobacterium symbioticum]|jgi:hypothetical protein|uniref:Uncharacterized protein n=1 Tax=Methylobacterium symbioticum TaxID=2584084 RepID=A0A509EK20_9HYPH|nr:hypothetical protein [Methylobacterium symbioticum]VUD73954.1 hypothetical protein MET9862_04577 [Methylobacterium symbioticum]